MCESLQLLYSDWCIVYMNDIVLIVLFIVFSICRYFFPTYENDNLLCQLEDEDDAGSNHGNEVVIAEDTPAIQTILSAEKLRRELLMSWLAMLAGSWCVCENVVICDKETYL